jgi:hypothetical protein
LALVLALRDSGWPKYALRSAYRTPRDGGIAIGAFVPVRVQLRADSVLLVATDYPFEDAVRVLVTNLRAPTPLRVRVPSWATGASALLNGEVVPASRLRNGTMLTVHCPPATLCNLTLSLNPAIRLESWYGSSVSVLRGSLLFSLEIGHKFTKYRGCAPISPKRGCGNAPFANRTGDEQRLFPPEAGWFGVEGSRPANLALVIPDLAQPQQALKLEAPGLPCTVKPAAASWPSCALSTPPTCERTCAAPWNHTDFPLYLVGQARCDP